jgi:hypothetical protein
MPHGIIDNREPHLGDKARQLLDQTLRAHFAVAHSLLSDPSATAKELEEVKELRLLIGSTSGRATVEQLAEGHALREAVPQGREDPGSVKLPKSPPART